MYVLGEKMFRLKIWLNPYMKEINIKGKNYKIGDNYQKKITLLNNLRIIFTVGLLVLSYLFHLYSDNLSLDFLGIILSVQIAFLGIFYLFLPNDIEKML